MTDEGWGQHLTPEQRAAIERMGLFLEEPLNAPRVVHRRSQVILLAMWVLLGAGILRNDARFSIAGLSLSLVALAWISYKHWRMRRLWRAMLRTFERPDV